MTRKFKIYGIDWDTESDGETPTAEECGLPQEVVAVIEVPDDYDNDSSVDEDEDDYIDDYIGDMLEDYLSDTYDFCVNGFCWSDITDDDASDAPTEEEILKRIGDALDGHFGCVENRSGSLYIDEGGATYSISVTKCDSYE